MSREGLIPQLQTRGIQLNELKYSQQSVSVYQGTFQTYAAAIKVLALVPGAGYTQLESECRTLISLAHPNILRLYDCFWEQQESSHYFVIVTEWCDKDLAKDVKQRAEHHYPWKEEELWKLAFEIVGALTYMQEQDISHRDIKPENIFLTSTKSAKLGDFGSARTFQSNIDSATLTGTPLYLSPKLREAFLNRNPKVVHNSFKSDVYSLGLTLLSLALSEPPQSLAKVNLTNAEVQAVINTVRYSELFRSMLTWMLSVEEDTRCDFKELKLWLDNKDSRNREPGPSKTGTNLTTSQMLPVSKPKTKPLCMQCGKVVDRYGAIAQCEVVQLYCEPYQHMFCSRECFKAYLSYGQFKCPQCSAEIPEETVVFYLPEQPKRTIPKVPEEGQRRIEKPSPVGLSNPAATEERKLPALTSQVATAPKPNSQPVCMQCGKVVDRYGKVAECEVVQLYCEPYQHMFCSRDCFKAYLSNGRFKCPQCKTEIPQETLDFYWTDSKRQQVRDPQLSGGLPSAGKKPTSWIQEGNKTPVPVRSSQGARGTTGKIPVEEEKRSPNAAPYHQSPATAESKRNPKNPVPSAQSKKPSSTDRRKEDSVKTEEKQRKSTQGNRAKTTTFKCCICW